MYINFYRYGARTITMVDIVQERVDFAKEYAATHSFLFPSRKENESNLDYSQRAAKELVENSGLTRGFDIVFEVAGADTTIRTSFFACRMGGTVMEVGLGNPETLVPFVWIAKNELSVQGAYR